MRSAAVLTCCLATLSGAGQSVSNQRSLSRYATCHIQAGPEVVETAPLEAGVKSRAVKTVHGSEQILLEDGKRVMFAFPNEDFYANVKAERIPAASYEQERKLLVESFDYSIVGSGDVERNYTLKRVLHGFVAMGADRTKLESGVLGIYQLFDDDAHEVLTIIS